MAPPSTAVTGDPPVGRVLRGEAPAVRQERRRRQLLDSALELFGTVGYRQVPIQRLCSHASVTARHFYEAFPSREALLNALHTELINVAAVEVLEAISTVPQDDPWAMTRAGLSAFFHNMLDDRRNAQVVCIEVMALAGDADHDCMDAFENLIETYGRMLADQGLVKTADVHLSSVMLAGAVKELMISWLRSSEPAEISALIDEAIRAFTLIGEFSSPRVI